MRHKINKYLTSKLALTSELVKVNGFKASSLTLLSKHEETFDLAKFLIHPSKYWIIIITILCIWGRSHRVIAKDIKPSSAVYIQGMLWVILAKEKTPYVKLNLLVGCCFSSFWLHEVIYSVCVSHLWPQNIIRHIVSGELNHQSERFSFPLGDNGLQHPCGRMEIP